MNKQIAKTYVGVGLRALIDILACASSYAYLTTGCPATVIVARRKSAS
jgi:hypothetical protein